MRIITGKANEPGGKIIEAEIEEETLRNRSSGVEKSEIPADTAKPDKQAKNQEQFYRRLVIYCVAGCVFTFLLVRALYITSRIWLFCLDKGFENTALPTMTLLSLNAPPFFYAVPVVFTLLVATGIFRKSARLLLHCLGLMLFTSVILVLFHTLGIVALLIAVKG